LKTRRAKTGVELRDGQSFALAGLLDNSETKSLSKVPFISDVPIIGNLFKSKTFQKQETELMFIITAQLVKPVNRDDLPAMRGMDGLKGTSPLGVEPKGEGIKGPSGFSTGGDKSSGATSGTTDGTKSGAATSGGTATSSTTSGAGVGGAASAAGPVVAPDDAAAPPLPAKQAAPTGASSASAASASASASKPADAKAAAQATTGAAAQQASIKPQP